MNIYNKYPNFISIKNREFLNFYLSIKDNLTVLQQKKQKENCDKNMYSTSKYITLYIKIQ